MFCTTSPSLSHVEIKSIDNSLNAGGRNMAVDETSINFDKKLNIVTEKRLQNSGSIRAPLLSVGSGRVNSESTGIYGDDDDIPMPFDPEWEIDRNCLQIQVC